MNGMVCGVCDNGEDDDMQRFSNHRCCGNELCMQENDHEHGSVKPHTLVAPSPPSKQKAQEHSITHLPYMSWCPFCVKGKAKASPHRLGMGDENPSVPMVAFDYCFMKEHGDNDNDGKDDVTGNPAKIIMRRTGARFLTWDRKRSMQWTKQARAYSYNLTLLT